jgi:hypothetical protein
VAYGFTVSAAGLGARTYNVGRGGAAFGVANNRTLNVSQLLWAVNQRAVNGVLYNGDAALRQLAADLLRPQPGRQDRLADERPLGCPLDASFSNIRTRARPPSRHSRGSSRGLARGVPTHRRIP